MRKIKRPQLGEYVLVTRWPDKDLFDPWCIGFLSAIVENFDGKNKPAVLYYKVSGSERLWQHAFRLTKEEGEQRLEVYKSQGGIVTVVEAQERFNKKRGEGGMRKRPRNLEDYSQCVIVEDDRVLVFCVECDRWRPSRMSVISLVTFKSGGVKTVDPCQGAEIFSCSCCEADVGHLFGGQEESMSRHFQDMKEAI